jgi:antitoxin CptB
MDARRKRLLFQARHRGMNENDILVGGFAAAYLADLSPAELDEFEAILNHLDIDLFSWLIGQVPLPPEHDGPVMRRLQAFCDEKRR